MMGDIILNYDQYVVGITLPEVPQYGKLTLCFQQSWLFTSLISSNVVTLLLKRIIVRPQIWFR